MIVLVFLSLSWHVCRFHSVFKCTLNVSVCRKNYGTLWTCSLSTANQTLLGFRSSATSEDAPLLDLLT